MTDSSSLVTPPSKADRTKYNTILPQIREDLELIGKSLRRLGRNLTRIRDERLYFCGGHATFEDFCRAELGKGRQHIYRLIKAHNTLEFLLDEGVPEQDLPSTERLIREIRQLDKPQQIPVWKAVLRAARNQQREPTIHDVQAEAVKVTQSDGAIERQQKELLGKFEGVARSLKVGVSFEVLTPEYRRRLVTVLQDIVDKVQTLLAAFQADVVERRTKAEESEPVTPLPSTGKQPGKRKTQADPRDIKTPGVADRLNAEKAASGRIAAERAE
jgi:hypothetical protein